MRTGFSGLAVLLAALALAGCTAHMAPATATAPAPAPGSLATIDVGSTVVRQIDGEHRRGGAFDVSAFEVAPGAHRLGLVFELPARSLGLKSLPAQAGVGICELSFEAQAGRHYYLLARPLGDFNSGRWSGAWEAWVRDPAIATDDDVIARCQGAEPVPTPTPSPLIAGGAATPASAAGVAAAPPAPTATQLLLPAARALRIGAWYLPQLATASPADVAAAAAAIRDAFDVLTIAPALAPEPLLSALGSAWSALPGSDRTLLFRRDLVRACTEAGTAAPCLEAVAGARGAAAPLLLQLPMSGASR